jgi:hypothetical protein
LRHLDCYCARRLRARRAFAELIDSQAASSTADQSSKIRRRRVQTQAGRDNAHVVDAVASLYCDPCDDMFSR